MGLDSLPDILTVKELADFIKVSTQTVIRAIKSGKLEAFKAGKDWRIEREAAIAWLKGSREQ